MAASVTIEKTGDSDTTIEEILTSVKSKIVTAISW